MIKKVLVFSFIIISSIILSGCTAKTGSNSPTGSSGDEPSSSTDGITEKKPGDGEPRPERPKTGQDSFGVDVCGELTKEIVGQTIGKTILSIRDFSGSTSTGCEYYTDEQKNEFVTVVVSYLSAENQKKGQEALGRSIAEVEDIMAEHFVVWQEDGKTINAIYLVMMPDKFVRIDRSSIEVIDNDMLIKLARKVAEMI